MVNIPDCLRMADTCASGWRIISMRAKASRPMRNWPERRSTRDSSDRDLRRNPPPSSKSKHSSEPSAPRGSVTPAYAELFWIAWVFAGPCARVKNFALSAKIPCRSLFLRHRSGGNKAERTRAHRPRMAI